MGGDIGVEVLVPLACLLAILVAAAIYIICRYYLCDKIRSKKRKHSRGGFGLSSVNGHPILPPFTSVLQPVQIKPSEQKTHYLDIVSPVSNSKYGGYSRISDDDIYYTQMESPTRTKSDASEMSFISDDTSISPAEKSIQSAKTYPGAKLSKQKKLCKSESSLLDLDSGPDSPFLDRPRTRSTLSHLRDPKPSRSRSSSTASNLRDSSPSAALSLVSPAGGQLEFVLFYNTEERSLDIRINQLIDITLDPEIFVGVLDVYEKGEKPRKKIKAYLKRNRDNLLELHHTDDIGFFVYITLIPKKIFRKYTNVVFGPGSTVFNEKISLTGYSLEQLAPFSLCFHALCKFGRDGEPIVLGEVRQPLKQLKNTQVLPVLANLGPPEEELELESALRTSTDLGYLEVFLSFNPMANKLFVKVIRAKGLPKFGMTGKPNVSVKTCLYLSTSRVSKCTTTTQKRSRHPEFNEKFEFDLSRDCFSECDILCEVRHHGSVDRTPIGFVAIGNSAGAEGRQHWLQLLDFNDHVKIHKIMPFKPVNLL